MIDDVQDPLVGAVLDDRYRIDRQIGQGGMGVVYLAHHVVLNKPLALKVLRRDLADDAEVVQRFVQEAQAASGIGHQNIVAISDFGRVPSGAVYFAMEYLDGETLNRRIKRGALPPDGESLSIVRQVASALSAAHAAGIVHRDLKPDNVFLVRRHGELIAKVLDFGIAKVARATGKLTKTGMVFGTPHYMSPEQAAGHVVDHRTDIYALGVILYEGFTGRVPFDADTFMGILSKHMFEPPIPPSQVLEALADVGPLENLILRCLAKDPADRYPSMDALLADLDVVARGGFLPAPRTSTFPLPPGVAEAVDARRPSPVLRWAAGAFAVFLGAVVAGIVLFASRGTGAPSATRDAAALPSPPPMAAPSAPGPTVVEPTTLASAPDPEPPPPPSSVSVVSEPAGAEVVVAGAVVGNTPTELLRPDPGEEREVELRLPGYQPGRLRLTEHSPETVSLQLERQRRSPPARRPRSRRPAEPSYDTPPPRPARGDRGSEVVDPWAR